MITCGDAEINIKKIIPKIKLQIDDLMKGSKHKANLKNLLIPESFDEKWVSAQCNSILEYIKLFNEAHISNIINGDKSTYAYRHLGHLTRGFIYQVIQFNSFLYFQKLPIIADPRKDEIFGGIQMDTCVSPMDVFNKAYSNTVAPFFPHYTDHTYLPNATPFYIRHAIELKIKNQMLGIGRVMNTETNNPEIILLNRYVGFLKKHGNDFFNLPLPINSIETVNKWSNNFIHTGQIEHIWEIYSAVLTVKPVFEGGNFRKSNFSESDLKTRLEAYFKNTDFTFIKST